MKTKRYTIYILGAQQSGKSSFFAGLGVVSDADRPNGVQLSCEGEGLRFIHSLTDHLRQGVWPPSTTAIQLFDADLRFEGKDIAVEWLDYPGERFVQHFAEGSPELGDLPDKLREGDFFLVALDPLAELAGAGELQASPGCKDRLNALLDALSKFRLARGNDRPLHLAALITKADLIGSQLQDAREAEKALRERAPGFLENLREQFPQVRVFATSAVGNTVKGESGDILPDPQRLDPWGYQAIFDWIVGEVRRERRRPLVRKVTAILIMAAVVLVGFFLWQWYQKGTDRNYLLETRQRELTPELRRERAEILRRAAAETQKEEIDRLISEAKEVCERPGVSRAELERAQEQLKEARDGGKGYRATEVDQIEHALYGVLVKMDYEPVKGAFDADAPNFVQLALDFQNKHANSQYAKEVGKMLDQYKRRAFEKDVNALRGKDTSTPEGLRQYQQQLLEFADKHKDRAPAELGEAARLAGRLADAVANKSFQVQLKTLGEISEGHEGYLGLGILLGNSKEDIVSGKEAPTRSTTKVTTFSFENTKEFNLPWRPGDPIVLQVFLNWGILYKEKMIAQKRLEGPLALAALDGIIIMESAHRDVTDYFVNGQVVLRADVLGWESRDWKLLEDWVFQKDVALQGLLEE